MERKVSIFQKIENGIMVIAFIIMIVASFAQVVNRNITKLPIGWFDELATYSMIYMVLIGTEIGLRDGTQISVTALTDRLEGKSKKIVQIIAKIIVVGFSSMIFITSLDMVKGQIINRQTSAALKIPMYIPYAALPIGFGIIVLVQGIILINMLKNFNVKESNELGGNA